MGKSDAPSSLWEMCFLDEGTIKLKNQMAVWGPWSRRS